MSFIHCHDENQSTFRAGGLQSGLRLHCAQKKPFWEGSGGLPACCKALDAPANPPCSRARSTARIQPGRRGNPFPGTQGTHCSPTAANPAGSSRQALLWAQLSQAPSVFHTDMYSLLQAAPQPPHKYILTHTHIYLYTHRYKMHTICLHIPGYEQLKHHCNAETNRNNDTQLQGFKAIERHLVTGPKEPFLNRGEDEGGLLPPRHMAGCRVHPKPAQKEELCG